MSRTQYYQPRLREHWLSASTAGFDLSELVTPDAGVRFFERDPTSKALYTISDNNLVSRLEPLKIQDEESVTHRKHRVESDLPYRYDPRKSEKFYGFSSPVSSMNFSAKSGTLVTTTYGGPNIWPSVCFARPEHDGAGISEVLSLSDTRTAYTSSTRPSFSSDPSNAVGENQTELVVVGKAGGYELFAQDPTGSWVSNLKGRVPTDILSTCWLDEKILALGARDGRVLTVDLRANVMVTLLNHASPVIGIKRADDFHRLVCAGINDSLVLYEMRMAKPDRLQQHVGEGSSGSRSSGRKKKRRTVDMQQDPQPLLPADIQGSQPLLPADMNIVRSPNFGGCVPLIQFAYANESYLELGLDTHPRLGLVAASDETGSILVWSMKNGTLLRDYRRARAFKPPMNKQGRERRVMFVDDDEGNSPVSIWAGYQNGGVFRFGW